MKRAARHKKDSKKAISFYKLHYGIKPPYSVIMDAEFLKACANNGLHPRHEVLTELDEKMTPITTNEILAQLKEEREWESFKHAKTFFLMKEKTKGTAVRENVMLISDTAWKDRELSAAAQSIKRIVGRTNENHYLVASNNADLRRDLGNVSGVPLMHVDEELKYAS
eukprot:TRINITY_DN3690_c0_g1_i1.p1 TRINITY_DN3690_c0_g1~~TRINITY_DN3690_c0_g1_i1.p1  ORF type:complete len:167 (+),score=47.90 TRINITY_DN3690_c0_g1_i1:34-534(+)